MREENYKEIQKCFGEIAKNATLWWVDKRPPGWDEKRHLENPGVNCSNAKELDIAVSVAKLIKLSGVATELKNMPLRDLPNGVIRIDDETHRCISPDGIHIAKAFGDGTAICGSCGRSFSEVPPDGVSL